MPYDSEKDIVVKEYDAIQIGRDNNLVVKIVKYANGEPKLSIQKTFKTKDGEERATSKIGRIDYETLITLHKIMEKAIDDIQKK